MTSKNILFERLNNKLGITTLNEMQLATLRYSEKEKDIILISPTGSGKTIAFLLPVLQGLDPLCKEIQALILVPSRELAMQINSISHSISSGYKINCCYGGQPIKSGYTYRYSGKNLRSYRSRQNKREFGKSTCLRRIR